MTDQVPQQGPARPEAPAAPPEQEGNPAALAILARKRRAETYFTDHLRGQREWYSREAGSNKRMTARLSFIILFTGSAIGMVQLLAGQFPILIPYVTAVLGAVVVLAKGLERIGKYEETWIGYRTASEGMKREFRLFINNAGDYANAANEEDAYRSFVEQVETIIADEEHQFWQNRCSTKDMEKPSPDGTPADTGAPKAAQGSGGQPQDAPRRETKPVGDPPAGQ